MSIMEKVWVDIGPAADVPIRGSRVVKAGATCIAIFRTAADEFFAVEDACPHKQGPLSQGIVHARAVTCPLHNWVIDLADGVAQGADEGKVETFPLRVEAGRLLLSLAASGKQKAL